LILATLAAVPLAAVDCSTPFSILTGSYGSTLNLSVSGFSNTDVQTSIGYWSGCAGYGSEFPTLTIGGSSGIPVSVRFINGVSTASNGGCGVTQRTGSNNRVTSATIDVWTQQNNGVACNPIDTLAHEFGHLFGLANALDPACVGHIMGARPPGGTRTVAEDDCAVANEMWTTPAEVPSPEPVSPPPGPNGGTSSPLVLGLDGGGFRFTDVAGGIEFDLDADGVPEHTAWLSPESLDGFLALDRNSDGEITDGTELFGDSTPQPPSETPNGFLALAVFDQLLEGGNGNGRIDPRDVVFDFLVVWRDEDHDGMSSSHELYPLADLGVEEIDLSYIEARRRDRYRNQLRYKSHARLTDRTVQVVDVFFLTE
jgi:hypothetical protein